MGGVFGYCEFISLYCSLSEPLGYIFCCLGSFQFEQLVNNSSGYEPGSAPLKTSYPNSYEPHQPPAQPT
jgi:hypothetical protein